MFDITLFAVLVWVGARFLNKTDLVRLQAQAELRRSHDELEQRVEERTAHLVTLALVSSASARFRSIT